MQKIRYEVDPHNRLVARKTGRKTEIKRFRKVYDGRFKVGKDNELTYHIKTPSQLDKNTPHQVKLKGKWSLAKKHDLVFTLDKWRRQTFGDKLTLYGKIIDVNKNSFSFALTTKTKDNLQSVYILKLAGSWQADKHNRLTFKIDRERGKHDILIFRGEWEINKNHQIIYQYEKAQLIRKLKKIRTLIFKGHWDVKDKARISYVLDKNTNSAFDFRTGFGIFRGKYIKYEIGVGLLRRRRKPIKKAIILFGRWKIKKNKGLMFEIKYGEGRVCSITFGAEAKLTTRDSILFKLKNDINDKDIGINLKLTRKMLKGDGEAFLRFLKERREPAVFIGAGKRW